MHKTINGYPFLMIHEPNKVIHLEVVVHSGFVYETKKNSGVNHLLEHVLVSGWKKCKESCNSYWDKHGALVNASTDDIMKYYIKGNRKDIPDMVDYISSIITRSLFFPTTLEREKKAVLEELTNLVDNPSQKIYNVFHKAFYKIEGLQYLEDCALQIKNVESLTMNDIKKAYEKFHTENCLFIVYGDFDDSIVSLFQKSLVSRPGKKIPIQNCFTYKHDILHTKYEKENTTLFIGFPSTKKTFFLPYFELLLHHLLFHELRTKYQYIYDIEIACIPSPCGVVTEIEINVQTKNAVKTFHALLDSLRRYQKKIVSDEYVEGIQKTMYYKYHTDYNFVDYYTFHEPLTKPQMIEKRKEFTSPIFRNLCKELCPIEKALCVYQGKEKLSLTWD
jgi:predicted Zn-dependent peptidase